MLITLCLIILGCMIAGKDVRPWVEKVESVDWKSRLAGLAGKLKRYAVKVGVTIETWFGPDYVVSSSGAVN